MNEKKYGTCAKHTSKKFQKGLSLMELMVGLTIGLMVVLAAVGNLVYTQLTSATVGDSSRLQQRADAVFRNIGFHVSQAGAIQFRSLSGDATGQFDTATYTGFDRLVTGAAPNQVFSIHGVDGGGNTPDILRISYQDDGVTRDCLGFQPDLASTNIKMDNQFSIVGANLMCAGSNNGTPPQSISDGIEDFQVLFGVQTFPVVGAPPQFQFLRADQVLNWTNINAVNICLQIVGENSGNPQPGLITTGCQNQAVPNDGLLRKVFRRTFSIRNALI